MGGSLVDLDPPPARERRWPFYAAWTMGGVVVGAILLSHLPGSVARPGTPVVTEAPAAAPATPQVAPRFRVAPVPLTPARP
jgi:hypothetical protein